jgi:hypothetical protein
VIDRFRLPPVGFANEQTQSHLDRVFNFSRSIIVDRIDKKIRPKTIRHRSWKVAAEFFFVYLSIVLYLIKTLANKRKFMPNLPFLVDTSLVLQPLFLSSELTLDFDAKHRQRSNEYSFACLYQDSKNHLS